jgi:hypothetical protein
MSATPSPNGANGRGVDGKFAPGWKGGPGNPHARHVARLRSALFKAVKPEDIKDVAAKLIEQAKAGDVASIKELFQRLFGPAEAIDFAERLEALEAKIEQLAENKSSWR